MLNVEELEPRIMPQVGQVPLRSPVYLIQLRVDQLRRESDIYVDWYNDMFVQNRIANSNLVAGALRAMRNELTDVHDILLSAFHELFLARMNVISANESENNYAMFSARYRHNLAEANRFIDAAIVDLYGGVEKFGSEAQTDLNNGV